MESNKEKEGIGEKINDFVQRNRKGIFISLGVFVLLFAGIIAFFLISDSVNKKATSEIVELTEEYEKLRFTEGADFHSADINALLSRLEVFAGKYKGFPGSKAWSNIAHIYSGRQDWAKAEEAWLNSARAGAKTYLGPIAFFQAAVAAEEQNKPEKAIEYLQQCVSHSFEFPDAPRAQFNIGRLYEQIGNFPGALEAYRAVLINWPWERSEAIQQNMYVWQNLARNQIIKLEMR
ncbi:MAG: tetratricopeptide repeat protein [Treponema sp.]|jgi:tetratricopeptide (TPR) repeat protein|nr:tetratricopeptide repeat protein [Treponema sp.]